MALSRIVIEFTKTYATEANAEKAVDKLFSGRQPSTHVRYAIMPVIVEGKIRYGVMFIGQNALELGVHWHLSLIHI